MNQERFINACRKIKRADFILLVTHDRPDGDALASLCAMIGLLESWGKKYTAWCKDAPPPQYGFLPYIDKVKYGKDTLNFQKHDLVIALDCGSLARTNLAVEIKNSKDKQAVIEFDHHPKIDDYADIEIRMPEASSTAEVIYYFLQANKLPITKQAANCILTGILTDTGNFLYPSTSDQTIKIAADMLLYGASYPAIMRGAYRNKSLAAMKLWGCAMSNLRVNEKYGIAYSVLTYDDLAQFPATDEELEGISGFLSNLDDVNALVFLREERVGLIRGSLRTSKPHVDVSKLARYLGGGGHKKASGFVINGHLEKIDSGYQIV